MKRLAEFYAPISDLDAPVGELLDAARAGLPAALAELGLCLAGGFRVGVDAGGLRVVVRVLVVPAPHPEPPPRVEPGPRRVRPSMQPVKVSKHQAHLEAVNAAAREFRAESNLGGG